MSERVLSISPRRSKSRLTQNHPLTSANGTRLPPREGDGKICEKNGTSGPVPNEEAQEDFSFSFAHVSGCACICGRGRKQPEQRRYGQSDFSGLCDGHDVLLSTGFSNGLFAR